MLRISWTIKRESGGSHRILSRPSWPDVVFAFHNAEEIGAKNARAYRKENWFKTGRSLAILSNRPEFGPHPTARAPQSTFVSIRVHSWLISRATIASTSNPLHPSSRSQKEPACSRASMLCLLSSFDALIGRCGEKENDTNISDWNAVRSDDHSRGYRCIRNSGQQRLLANGDLETRRRRLDCGSERPFWLDVDG
jgi:hypothetical protein